MGYRSWYELAQKVGTADQLAAKHGKDTFKAQVKWNEESNPTVEAGGMEVFECDVMTLKMRAFDELNKQIPTKEEIEQMLHNHYQGQRYFAPCPPEGDTTAIFFKNLLKLMR